MENLLASVVKQKFLVCLLFAFCVVGGLIAVRSLPIDAFPDLSNNQVQVITETRGMAPLETEQLVTIPLESLMQGLPNVQQVRSVSKFGISVVTVVFKDNVNIYFARQLINERLQTAKGRLPDSLNPEMGPITTGMGEIYQYVIEGNGYSPMDLKTLHDWDVKYQLRTVPGVNEVNTWGGLTQEYIVTVLPDRLPQYGLTLGEVFRALQENNDNFSGGIIEHQAEQYVVRGTGRIDSVDAIGDIIIKYRGSTPVFIRNVANVGIGPALRQGAASRDGKGEVVAGIVMMLKGENSQNVIERVKNKIQAIRKGLPESVRIRPFYDQTQLVEQTIHTVKSNLVEGALLVMAVLLFMLGNVRAALIVTITIPLSLMFSFMGMKALGISANIMSLGALDFGMIVDGAIVMVENTLRKLSHEPQPVQNTTSLIQASVREMARPILFGVLIITVVYMPVLALEGMEYKMFSPMVFTVTFALLGSLLVALFLVPVLCALFLKGRIVEHENVLLRKLAPAYLRLLDWALNHRKITVGFAVCTFLLTLLSLPFLGTEFVPKLDEGSLLLNSKTLPSVSLEETVKINTLIESVVKSFPEVKTIVSKAGRADLATDPMGVYETDAYVMLKPKDQWRPGVTKQELRRQIGQKLNRFVPGVHFNFSQPIEQRVNELVSGVRSDVAIKLFGEDIEKLTTKAREIEQVIHKVPGQTDLQVEKLSGNQQLLIVPDRIQMARYGVNISDIREIIETAILGSPVSEVLDGKRRFTLRVKLPGGSQTSPEEVAKLLVETEATRVPLAQVARIELGEGLEAINREMGQRRIIIQMNVPNRDIGSFVREAQSRIHQQIKLPPGYYIEWGGQFENQQRAMNRLAVVVPVSIIIILLLLMGTFASLRHALLVMVNVPFALIGGVVALWVRGMYLNVPAAIGFIALFGVAILNGLVLVNTINQLLAQNTPLREAILQAAKTRLRPVLITALVAILGFLPMAISQGAGAEVQKPLATVVIGGIFSSTLLTLIVLPVLYQWVSEKFDKRRAIG